jgi:hypothetical protein
MPPGGNSRTRDNFLQSFEHWFRNEAICNLKIGCEEIIRLLVTTEEGSRSPGLV